MENVLIHIHNDKGTLLKRYRPKTESDLRYRVEMMTGIRFLELRPQLDRLCISNQKSLSETHSVFCSYEKFGACHQQQRDFSITIQQKT